MRHRLWLVIIMYKSAITTKSCDELYLLWRLLAEDVSIEAIRDVHGEDGQCWQVQGAGRDHHAQEERPVKWALSSVVIAGSYAAELLGKGGAEEDRDQGQPNNKRNTCIWRIFCGYIPVEIKHYLLHWTWARTATNKGTTCKKVSLPFYAGIKHIVLIQKRFHWWTLTPLWLCI